MQDLVDQLSAALKKRGYMVAAAESSTGGLIAATLTEWAGSSTFFDRGFVTYSNEAKEEMLGVPHATLKTHGAVSAQTAKAMTEGALNNSRAQVAVSVTGVAGPGGGTIEKPVGLVYFGYGVKGHAVKTDKQIFSGDRASVRRQTVEHALSLLIKELADHE